MRALLELFHIVVLLIAALWAKTRKASLRLYVLNGTTLTEITMPITLTSIQKIKLTVIAKDEAKNPAAFPAPLVWASSDETSVKVVPNDESSAYAVAVGPVGSATIRVASGTLEKSVLVQVVPAEAASLEIVAGEPELNVAL